MGIYQRKSDIYKKYEQIKEQVHLAEYQWDIWPFTWKCYRH